MKYLNYILIVLGAIIAMYANSAGETKSQFVLIGGIVILMLGIYRVSKDIPSKHDREDDNDDNI